MRCYISPISYFLFIPQHLETKMVRAEHEPFTKFILNPDQRLKVIVGNTTFVPLWTITLLIVVSRYPL